MCRSCCWTASRSWEPTRRCVTRPCLPPTVFFIVDMQGVTGTRQEIFVLPYRKIVHFGIQTAGFGDPLQTSQLTVCYADEHEMKFGFIGQEELLAVAKAISRCIL